MHCCGVLCSGNPLLWGHGVHDSAHWDLPGAGVRQVCQVRWPRAQTEPWWFLLVPVCPQEVGRDQGGTILEAVLPASRSALPKGLESHWAQGFSCWLEFTCGINRPQAVGAPIVLTADSILCTGSEGRWVRGEGGGCVFLLLFVDGQKPATGNLTINFPFHWSPGPSSKREKKVKNKNLISSKSHSYYYFSHVQTMLHNIEDKVIRSWQLTWHAYSFFKHSSHQLRENSGVWYLGLADCFLFSFVSSYSRTWET